MSGVPLREYVAATFCIGVLVIVAMFGAYSGIDRQRPFTQSNLTLEEKPGDNVNPSNDRINSEISVKHPTFSNSETLPQGGSKQTRENIPDIEANGTEFWPIFLGLRLKITDTLLVIFTAILSFATIRLWISTEMIVTSADRTAERQLRAYVSVKPTVIFDFSANRIASVIVIARNDGATPARKFRWRIFLQRKSEDFLLSDQNFPDMSENRTDTSITLQPRADFEIFARYDALLTEHDISEILAGTGNRIYVFGQINYDDIFGQECFTKFCAYVDSKIIGEVVRAQSARDWNRMGAQIGRPQFPIAREETNIITSEGLWIFTIRHNDAT